MHVWWPGIFPGGRAPESGWHDGALEFWQSPVPCPHRQGAGSGPRTLDLAADGDYLVGSFQQAYGIDLTDPGLDMHWHRFQALLRSLPQDAIVSRIAGWRSWTPAKSRKKPDEAARQLRDAWSLERIQDGEAIAEQQELLGGVAEAFAREREAEGEWRRSPHRCKGRYSRRAEEGGGPQEVLRRHLCRGRPQQGGICLREAQGRSIEGRRSGRERNHWRSQGICRRGRRIHHRDNRQGHRGIQHIRAAHGRHRQALRRCERKGLRLR